MNVTWLFEVGVIYSSTQKVSWDGKSYIPRIVPNSFSGITMRWDISGNSLIAPNDVQFDFYTAIGYEAFLTANDEQLDTANDERFFVFGKDFDESDFENQYVTIRLVVDGVEKRTWIFKIKSAVERYGLIKCRCADFLQDYLEGSWPNTPHPSSQIGRAHV